MFVLDAVESGRDAAATDDAVMDVELAFSLDDVVVVGNEEVYCIFLILSSAEVLRARCDDLERDPGREIFAAAVLASRMSASTAADSRAHARRSRCTDSFNAPVLRRVSSAHDVIFAIFVPRTRFARRSIANDTS